jgi:pyridoxamine 5'-phosphate oxidase
MGMMRLLSVANSPPDPFSLFDAWFARATRAKLPHVNAMTLSTATAGGRTSSRIVLLKGVDERGFVFFTNYRSNKARQLALNPRASLLFFWPELELQVRIDGKVKKVGEEESDAYFATRPRESQLGAHASDQSRPLKSRVQLVRKMLAVATKYSGMPVPRPKNWGGYVLSPVEVEFWTGRKWRLHDRLLFKRVGKKSRWVKSLLSP